MFRTLLEGRYGKRLIAGMAGFGSLGVLIAIYLITDNPAHHAVGASAFKYTPTSRPGEPVAQHPEEPTKDNTDAGKPPLAWQRATGDWAGYRTSLEERGLTFGASLSLEGAKDISGGRNTSHWSAGNIFNANLTVDTEKSFGWKGGTFFGNFQNQAGSRETPDGAVQESSDVSAVGRTQISDLWYEQVLLDGKVRIKFGKVDANTEFAHLDNSGEFINSSMAFSPTIVGLPSHPDPAMGINMFVYPNENLYAGFGAYDGSTLEGKPTGNFGPARFFDGPSNWFLIGEAGGKWITEGRLDGKVGIGVWHNSGDVARFDGSHHSGATGPYLIIDQTMWRENPREKDDSQGIGMYFQYGYANPALSPVEHHVGIGAQWTGALPTRDDDVLGLGVSWAKLSNAPGAGFNKQEEIVTELFYKFRVTKFFAIKPDLQFIHNPGGLGDRRDAALATFQGTIDF